MSNTERPKFEDLKSIQSKNATIEHILAGKGVDPEILRYLNNDEIPTPQSYERRFILWAVAATVFLVFLSVYASESTLDYEVNGKIKEVFDLLFTPGNAPVDDAQLTTIIRQFGQWGISFLEQGTLIATLLAIARLIVTRTDQIITLIERRTRLQVKVESGKISLPMPEGYTAINLGTTNDEIGKAIGKALGWTQHSLPLIEGPTNLSGSDFWVQLSNPCKNFDKTEFFNSLDSVRFNLAGWLVLCPVKADQAFLPNIKNSEHSDWNLAETVREIELYDEYCRRRRISLKPTIIIADSYLSNSVAPHVEERRQVTRVRQTLKDKVTALNETRSEASRIVLVDPTEIVLNQLAQLQQESGGLPLEFYKNPDSKENYASRFIARCRKRNPPIAVKTDGDPSLVSIKVVYSENDVESRHLASLVGPERTAVIVADATQQMSSPYHSIIISELIKDYVINSILLPDKALYMKR